MISLPFRATDIMSLVSKIDRANLSAREVNILDVMAAKASMTLVYGTGYRIVVTPEQDSGIQVLTVRVIRAICEFVSGQENNYVMTLNEAIKIIKSQDTQPLRDFYTREEAENVLTCAFGAIVDAKNIKNIEQCRKQFAVEFMDNGNV